MGRVTGQEDGESNVSLPSEGRHHLHGNHGTGSKGSADRVPAVGGWAGEASAVDWGT